MDQCLVHTPGSRSQIRVRSATSRRVNSQLQCYVTIQRLLSEVSPEDLQYFSKQASESILWKTHRSDPGSEGATARDSILF